MSATMTQANSRPRKQLADQLDRLDDQLDRLDDQLERVNGVIDALAEGLNGAVADAAKEGVKEAVAAAVVELLTNPDLRAALHQASGAPAKQRRPADQPESVWGRLRTRVRAAIATVKEAAAAAAAATAAAAEKVVAAGRAVAQATAGVVQQVREAGPARTAARLLVAAGVAAVAIRFAAPKHVERVVAAVVAAGTTVASWVLGRARAALTSLGLV